MADGALQRAARGTVRGPAHNPNIGRDQYTYAQMGSDVADWAVENPLDAAAMATAPIPVVGDVVGGVADLNALIEDPSWTNAGLMAAGLIPFVPAGTVGRVAKKVGFNPKKAAAPEDVSLNALLYGDEILPIESGRAKNKLELSQRLNERARERLGGPITPDMYDDNARQYLARVMAAEAKEAAARSGNAATWYRDKVQGAHRVVDQIYGGLKPSERSMFNFGLAVTSNGASVPENAKMALGVFDYKRQNGRFPERLADAGVGGGKEARAMENAFKIYNRMADKIGEDEFIRFLDSDVTNKELKAVGFPVTGEGMGTKLKGSAILGPKIGQGFFQNLEGNFSPLTSDRWWMRTWGRITGQLVPDPDPKALAKQRSRLKEAIKTKEGRQLVRDLGFKMSDLKTNDGLDDFADRAFSRYSAGGFKDRTEVNRAAQRIAESKRATLEYPRGGKERDFMRATVADALDILRQDGLELETADLQALLWYPEKELYSKYGIGGKRAAPTDYEREFTALAESRGIDFSGSGRGSVPDVGGGGQPGLSELAGVTGRPVNRPDDGQIRSGALEALSAIREQGLK